MKLEHITTHICLVACLSAALATGAAFAQGRGGDGGRGGGGHGGGGSSFSGGRGGGGGGPSMGGGGSRSFSGGGGGSSRSFSGDRGGGPSLGGGERAYHGGGQSRSGGAQFGQGSQRGESSRGDAFRSQTFRGGESFRSGSDRGEGASERRSFYGGRDVDRGSRDFDRGDRDQYGRDFDRDRDFDRGDFNRGDRGQFGRDFDRDRGDRDRGDRWWDRGHYANDIRGYWRGHHRDLPFRHGWWDGVGFGRWPYYLSWRNAPWHDRPYYWWTWSPRARVWDWLVYDWSTPYYWDYGPGGYIYYRDNMVYLNNRPYLPADRYYENLDQLAHEVPPPDSQEAKDLEWLPLGVFAVAKAGASDGHQLLQLAVSKNGIISGTYYNQDTGASHPIEGKVNEETQQAVWAFADGSNPDLVMEASINSLTEPEATMLVHFGPQDSEIWHMVRLEPPESS